MESEEITIRFVTDNAAFADSPTAEIGRILHKLADQFSENGCAPDFIMDINGNRVGTVSIMPRG